MQKEVSEYLDYLQKQRNYSLFTINNYKHDLALYQTFLEEELIDYKEIDYTLIHGLFHFLDKRHLSNTSVARITSSIRGFYRYLVNKKVLEANPFLLVSTPSKEKKLPKFLYENEINALLGVDDTTTLGKRDHLIVLILYATGLRVSELVNIKLQDIDLIAMNIKVLGKGNKERYVYFQEKVKKELLHYLKSVRIFLDKKKSDYLFLNKNGGNLSTSGVRLILNKLINKASLQFKISPHVLRHTFATHLLNNGCDITSVQTLLGHTSLKATQIYTHVTNEHLKEIYQHTHPRSLK